MPAKKRLPLVRTTLALAAAALAIFVVPTIWGKPWSINHFYLRTLAQFLLQSPMICSSLHLLDFRKDQLDDYSLAQRVRLRARVAKDIDTLHRYDRGSLGPADQLSYDVMDWFLKDLQSNEGEISGGVYAFDQLNGLHVALPNFLTTQHAIKSKSDAEAYLARVAASGVAFDQVIAVARDDAARGIVPPRFILRKVRADAAAFAELAAEKNVVTIHLIEKVAALSLSDAEKATLGNAARARVEDTLRPAYRRFIALIDELEKNATDDAGVWKLPDGERRYQAALHSGTASELTAAQVHEMGLAQVDRLENEVRLILAARGVNATDVGPPLRALAKDPQFLYPATAEGKKQMIAGYQAIIDDIEHKTDALFHDKPRVGVKVEAVPDYRAKTAPRGQYSPPPLDNSKPGTFFANIADIGSMPKFAMRTLAYHEAIPGHHFQIVIARQQKELPMFRQLIPFNAYVEGWALYAEQLAAENGFEADPLDRLGFLQAQLLRAARLVVDTGLHWKRWSREQAIDYMSRHTAEPDVDAVIETERYSVWPGQACGYMVGMLKILELRERARAKLGPKFDLRLFHDTVLEAGALPMPLLERVVDAWVARSVGDR